MRAACCYRSLWGLCIALLLLLTCSPVFAQQTSSPAGGGDEAQIRELDAKWSKTASGNDVDGTVSYYSEDASLLPPNAPIATGKQAIRAVWASLLAPGNSLSWQANKIEVARSGDLAYVIGPYQLAMKNAQDRGKFVEVWKKQADGQWKVVVDMFSSDLPAPAAQK
jgi:ketosteroid isomerase-like protein